MDSWPTGSTKFVMEVQSWFCDGQHYDSGLGCNVGGPYQPVSQDPNYDNGQMYVKVNDGHAYVSYTTWYQPTTDARAVNMWDRGGDVAALDWYGGPNDCPPAPSNNPNYNLSQFTLSCGNKISYADASGQDMLNSIRYTLPAQRPGADMTLFLILDQGTWNGIACPKAGQTGQYYEPWCAANKMIADLNYALNDVNEAGVKPFYPSVAYFSSPNYFTVGGLPVIGFFQDEADDLIQCSTANPCIYDNANHTCTSQSLCFSEIYQAVTNWLNSQASPLGNNHYYRIFAYDSGCPKTTGGHPYSDGCYAWVKPYLFGNSGNVNTSDQLWSASAQPTLDTFYSDTKNGLTGANGQAALILGASFKGFDDYEANWATDRIITQGCGTTWLNTFNEPKKYFTGSPIPYMMVETWDDYEEGTETETGISNCLDDSSFTLQNPVGTTLKWSFTFDSSFYSVAFNPSTTINSFPVYASTDQQNYFLGGTAPAASCSYAGNPVQATCSVALPTYVPLPSGKTYYLVVQAQGQPMITNHISNNSVPYTP